MNNSFYVYDIVNFYLPTYPQDTYQSHHESIKYTGKDYLHFY